MSATETTPAKIREEGFKHLQSPMIDLALFAQATAFISEHMLADHMEHEKPLSLSFEEARVLDYMVVELASRVEKAERQWADAHNAACHAEYQEMTR